MESKMVAVNLFLHQRVLRGGLPFNVEMPRQRTLDAMDEARNAPGSY